MQIAVLEEVCRQSLFNCYSFQVVLDLREVSNPIDFQFGLHGTIGDAMKKLIGVVVLLAAAGTLLSYAVMGDRSEEVQYFASEVTRGAIQNTVTATGHVEAVVNVQVGSQVTGQIQSLYADFNSLVTEGQLLARLDPRNLETQFENTRANLVSSRARIKTAQADLTNSEASLASAKANLVPARVELEKAEIDLGRANELFEAELIPVSELEGAEAVLQSARARQVQTDAAVQQAEAQIVSRESGLVQAEAQLAQADAQLEEARINLGYTEIRSPVDGVVISREVDVGQTVSASTSAPTLFQIANDLTRMRVQASISEADIGMVAQSNDVRFTVDAYPTDSFEGDIEEIRLNPTTTQNVVTYSVIVGVENPELRLKPGMTANITITVDHREDTLSVANTALRYMPPNVDAEAIRQNTRSGAPAFANAGNETTEVARFDRGQFSDRSAEGGFSGGTSEGFDPGQFGGSREGRAVIRDTVDATTNRASLRDSISSLPGQLWNTVEKIQFQTAPPQPPRAGQVWVLASTGEPEMRSVMLGMNDGSRSELLSGDLVEGDALLIGDSTQMAVINNGEGDDTRNMFRMLRGGGGGGH
jgi:HlyD family secretion protein